MKKEQLRNFFLSSMKKEEVLLLRNFFLSLCNRRISSSSKDVFSFSLSFACSLHSFIYLNVFLFCLEILRFTPESHPDYAACAKALTSLEHIGNLINEARRQFEFSNRLVHIAKHSSNASAAGGQ